MYDSNACGMFLKVEMSKHNIILHFYLAKIHQVSLMSQRNHNIVWNVFHCNAILTF